MNKTQYPLVALIGRPNVGKSTFFNRLIKSRKAIVDPTPGVTRDRHYEEVTWDEHKFILIDTGGIEIEKNKSTDPRFNEKGMEQSVQDQTWQAIEDADVILFILDGRQNLTAEDYKVVSALRKTDKPLYYVVNKIDGPEVEQTLLPTFYELGAETLWAVSASHGYGIPTLLDTLVKNFPVYETSQQELPPDTLKIACIGRPNVGKSSLINRILGEERMVVSDVPGTTRDSVDTLLEKKGARYLLIDTAGIRRKGKVQDKLEKFSVIRALSAIERSDIALILIDAKEGITDQDTKVIGYALERGRACIVLINKWDLIKEDKKQKKWILEGVERATRFIGYAPSMTISVLTGAGLKQLFPTISEVFKQYSMTFPTNRLNKILQNAVESHSPALHKGKRIKLYYTTQISTRPPTFIIFVNYPDGVHFSYYRYLVNAFREGLDLKKSPVRIFLRERKRV
jgi:GTP-binding protein